MPASSSSSSAAAAAGAAGASGAAGAATGAASAPANGVAVATSSSSRASWTDIHADLEAGRFIGAYGGANAAYHGLAGLRAGVDMAKFHSKRSPDEFYVEDLAALIRNPKTQEQWRNIITLDPLGMFATRPTMSATEACMMIPELQLTNALEPDGKIVRPDLSINCVKCAIDFVWNLPLLAERLQMDEAAMRRVLTENTKNPELLDTSRRAYLPPVGGCTLYFFGDISKLADPTTEVAVRVHDECCGSDVFGTDICTCRPYLVFALQAAVQCAQRGGVSVIAYFRKEGRSLGEVTKFRVYNARKRQPGGDTPENYFKQTEQIAGIRDARFQPMMPDVLLWLGIRRIDWLLSMSSDKYDAIVGAGIEVMQRVSLPDSYVPPAAQVEITAKISAGYHTDAIAHDDVLSELRTLDMVRTRCQQIYQLAVAGKTRHFALDLSRLDECTEFVLQVCTDSYKTFDAVPYHSRWRHFRPNDVEKLVKSWRCDDKERVRRLIDLVTISVLLDAGAGADWHYIDVDGKTHVRSEGLAIATFDMFRDGVFSSDPAQPFRVNSHRLKSLTLKEVMKGFQVTENNPMLGVEGRYKLLRRVGKALESFPEFFGEEVHRPGHMLDYMLAKTKGGGGGGGASPMTVSLLDLWQPVIIGFEHIWPTHGVRRGDVWTYSPIKVIGHPASDLVPFHKLSQWLTYSLLEPLESYGLHFTDLDKLTALAEYRNGGLFVDMGVIVPKRAETSAGKEYDVGSELVVEWRALTVCLVDAVWERLRARLGKSKEQLLLMKVLQGGTWTAGRKAAEARRTDRSSPILVRLDGTVF